MIHILAAAMAILERLYSARIASARAQYTFSSSVGSSSEEEEDDETTFRTFFRFGAGAGAEAEAGAGAGSGSAALHS